MWVSGKGARIFLAGDFFVKRQEVSERYQIPLDILREYESWAPGGAKRKGRAGWQYDDTDLERLGTLLTLYEIGFSAQEARTYMCLPEESRTAAWRLQMLKQKRAETLEEIHRKERQLQKLDYLRYEIQKTQGGKKP